MSPEIGHLDFIHQLLVNAEIVQVKFCAKAETALVRFRVPAQTVDATPL
jgi:hypothetical protein